jgi:OmpA-OmpF porin, OOP family
MSRKCKIFLAAVLFGAAAVSAAGQGQDAEGCKDHPLLSRYPASVILECRSSEFDELTLPLGKTNGDGVPAKTQQLEGKITRISYEAPAHRSILEIYRNYEAALTNAGFKVLFSCINNDGCGSDGPTLWPAQGTEDWDWKSGQRYLAAKLSRPEGDAYVSLHVGQWADVNRGASTIVYVVEAKPMESGLVTVNAAALAGDITRTGHAAVYGIYFDTGKADLKPESDAALAEISKMLNQDAALKVYVVGHTDNQGTLASNMDLSKRRADAVVNVLITKYNVPAARLNAQGDGPTAPVASNDSEEGRSKNRRVELVKQ